MISKGQLHFHSVKDTLGNAVAYKQHAVSFVHMLYSSLFRRFTFDEFSTMIHNHWIEFQASTKSFGKCIWTIVIFSVEKLSKEVWMHRGDWRLNFSTLKIIWRLIDCLRAGTCYILLYEDAFLHINLILIAADSLLSLLDLFYFLWYILSSNADSMQVCSLCFYFLSDHNIDAMIIGSVTSPHQHLKQPLNYWQNYTKTINRVQGGIRGRSNWWHLYFLFNCKLIAFQLRDHLRIMILKCWTCTLYSKVKVWKELIQNVYELIFLSILESNMAQLQLVVSCSLHHDLWLLNHWKIDAEFCEIWFRDGNILTICIEEILWLHSLCKEFPYAAKCINSYEFLLTSIQGSNPINSKHVQVFPHHQMLYTPHYNTLQKSYIFFALLVIMSQSSNSAQNTNSTENSHPTPYSPDTLDYCLVGRLLTTKPVRFQNFKTCMSTLWQPKHQVDIT